MQQKSHAHHCLTHSYKYSNIIASDIQVSSGRERRPSVHSTTCELILGSAHTPCGIIYYINPNKPWRYAYNHPNKPWRYACPT